MVVGDVVLLLMIMVVAVEDLTKMLREDTVMVLTLLGVMVLL